jgi:5-methylcytosine-specific restriction endonuclease McrBC regulatory subunit McrC
MIKTVDNFNSQNFANAKSFEFDSRKTYADKEKKIIGDQFEITLKSFRGNAIPILDFFSSKDTEDNEDDLIISIRKGGDRYIAQTGNYIGTFHYNKLDIEITSRFGDTFLKHMLNYANDVYLDGVDVAGRKISQEKSTAHQVIYYLFIQRLEKAFLLGLPKAYQSIRHHDTKLRGRIDINRFIRQDIPFRGKLASVSREQKETPEIIDVLHKAVTIVEKNSFSTRHISRIRAHLKQNKTTQHVTPEVIRKALEAKALRNPIYAPYKSVLRYAKMIIELDTLIADKQGKETTMGFVVNVAKLFELYLVKLLRRSCGDEWNVVHEDPLETYPDQFYQRKMYPDIVLKNKNNQVIVFDAKYKRMHFRGTSEGMWDLDRADFFQIHTYMSYYKNKGYDVIAGGLLYPIEETNKNIQEIAHAKNWLGNNDTQFIVDGIVLSREEDFKEENIKKSEREFIERIRQIANRVHAQSGGIQS